MSVHQDEKLSKFLIAINDYAEQQRKKILHEVEEHNQEELEKAEHDVLAESYSLIQNELAEMRSEMSRDVSRAQLEERNRLLKKRSEIEQKVFDSARCKLIEFTSSQEYIDKLLLDAKEMSRYYQDMQGITALYVKNADMKYADSIQGAFTLPCEVKSDDTIEIGGIRAVNENRGLIADATFDTGLMEQHAWFSENSGLSISRNEA